MTLFGKYWGVVLAVLPFYIGFSKNIFPKQIQLFHFIAVCLFSLIFFEKKSHKLDLLTILAIGYFCVMGFLNQWNPYSGNVVLQWLCICLGCGVFIQMLGNFKDEDSRYLLNIIAITTCVQVIWVIGNKFGFHFHHFLMKLQGHSIMAQTELGKLSLSNSVSIVGSLNHPTHSGAMIAAGTISMFRGNYKYLIPFSLYALYLTGSAMSAAALFFGCVLLFTNKYEKFKKYVVASPFVGITVYYLYGTIGGFFSDTARFIVWEKLLSWPRGINTLIGFGPGYLPDKFKSTFDISPAFLQAHNEFIETYLMFGIIGLILSFVFIHKISLKQRYIYFTAILFALVVNSLGNFTFHIGPLSAIGLICLTFTYLGTKENNNGIYSN